MAFPSPPSQKQTGEGEWEEGCMCTSHKTITQSQAYIYATSKIN